ncbi:MAG: AbrB/MazE/SpoVT family DNA-binding domain-containing protein [Candidatus Omnitrophica bacterium]|nr:AbrB/MazE/SpoVT family DNA-binding domain-containing protein [Candidatus Omnitrophota bacterium]
MTITISERGQMVIPAVIRKKYKIKAQTKVELLDTGKEIVIVPIPKASLRQSRGILKGVNVKDLIAARREERRYEHKD